MIGVDYTGIATLVAAIGASVAGIIAAVVGRGTRSTVNDVHAQVTPSNGETLAGIVEGNDLRDLDPKNPPPKPAA